MIEMNDDCCMLTDNEFREWLSTYHSLFYSVVNRSVMECTESTRILSEFALRLQPHQELELVRLIKDSTRVHNKQRRRAWKKRRCGIDQYYQSRNYDQFSYLFEGNNPNLAMKVVGRTISVHLLEITKTNLAKANFTIEAFNASYVSPRLFE